MNPFERLKNLFTHSEKQKEPALADRLWVQGHKAFCLGKDCYEKRQIEEAMRFFDFALECGYDDDIGLFFMRGWCLQNMGYDLDAIDDFSKAIELEPEDGNNYFLRSISKGSAGDLFGRIADLKEAVRLVGVDNKHNKAYDLWAKEKGYNSCAHFFQVELNRAEGDLDFFKDAFDPTSRQYAHMKEFFERRSNKKRRHHIK